MDWICKDSNGTFGGILLMWDKRAIAKVEEVVGLHFVSCKFREVASGFEWAFLVFLVPPVVLIGEGFGKSFREFFTGGMSPGV